MSASVQCKTTRANPIYKQTLKIRFSFPLATWIEAIPFFFVELNRHIAYTQKLSLLSGKSGIEIIHWIEAEYNWICETFTETAKRLECVIIVTRHRFTDPRTNAHQDILMIKHNPSGQKHTNELRYGFNRFTTICILFGFVWCGLIVKSVLYVCAAMWITLKSSLWMLKFGLELGFGSALYYFLLSAQWTAIVRVEMPKFLPKHSQCLDNGSLYWVREIQHLALRAHTALLQ